jgi:hypothetical protein
MQKRKPPSPNGPPLFQEHLNPLLIVDPFHEPQDIPRDTRRHPAESESPQLPAPNLFFRQCTSTKTQTNCKALVSVIDPHCTLVASAGLCRFLGLTKEETRGQPIGLLCGTNTDCIAISNAIKSVRSDEEPKIISSLPIYDKNGHSKTVKVVCSPHEPTTNGRFTHCCMIFEPSAMDMQCKTRQITPEGGSYSVSSLTYRARYNSMTGLEIQRSLLERDERTG